MSINESCTAILPTTSSSSSSKVSTTNRIPMFTMSEKPSSYVKLNVGGYLFYTTVGTLVSRSEWFHAMFSGRQEVKADEDGWILIDRCGKQFGTILNFLRDGEVFLPETKRELHELLQEARFFCIEDLQLQVERELLTLKQREEEAHLDTKDLSTIVIIKCPRVEKSLLSVKKPIVKLKMNRCNNVFSYTTNSHDVLLRHIECLERYSLMFRDTVLFIRDVRNEKNEVCEWSFYYRGYQLKKIDCSSIHYSTDARLTKVEFPESKIHEEMLNLISLATRNISDGELLDFVLRKQNTTSAATGPGVATNLGLLNNQTLGLFLNSAGSTLPPGSERDLMLPPAPGPNMVEASMDEVSSEMDTGGGGVRLVSVASLNSFGSMSAATLSTMAAGGEAGPSSHSQSGMRQAAGATERDRGGASTSAAGQATASAAAAAPSTSHSSTTSHLRRRLFSSFSRRSHR